MDGFPASKDIAGLPDGAPSDEPVIAPQCAGLVMCLNNRRLGVPGQAALKLTRLETRLLAYLAAHRGREICKEELLQTVWRYHPKAATHTVETHVWRIRRKLAALVSGAELVRRGTLGYTIAKPIRTLGSYEQAMG